MWLRSVNIFLVISIVILFSDFYKFINLVKGSLVSLVNAYKSIGLIKFKEKI